MCIIIFRLQSQPSTAADLKLVLIANRDEYLDRATTAAHLWPDRPQLLAGRDGERGGTWLGLTTSGRLAALTNFRCPPDAVKSHAKSRGRLLSDFLAGQEDGLDYLRRVAADAAAYNDFNLLLGDLPAGTMCYYGSRHDAGPVALEPDKVYGVCNAVIDTPWPKVVRGKAMFAAAVTDWERALAARGTSGSAAAADLDALSERLFAVLSDRTPADVADLPDTGVGRDWELALSSIFVPHINRTFRMRWNSANSASESAAAAAASEEEDGDAPESAAEATPEGGPGETRTASTAAHPSDPTHDQPNGRTWRPHKPGYGTRSQAVLLVGFDGRVVLTERTFLAPSLAEVDDAPLEGGSRRASIVESEYGRWRETRFEFQLPSETS